MGTPDFAVPSLKALLDEGYEVVGVITATDKWGGRGNKTLIESAVKQFAREQGLKILQPKNLKSPEFQEELRALQANLQIVVAFRMLPESVWAMPEYGTFNLHGSLLPKFRGAAPIHWAVINGETKTGVTTFFIQHQIDTGDMILQEELSIGSDETTGSVHDRMMELGAEAVIKTVRMIESENYTLQKQDDSKASKAPKLSREVCEIDFHQPTDRVYNFIRGMSPYPSAWTTLEGKTLKLFEVEKIIEQHDHAPGSFHSNDKNLIKIATLDGFIIVNALQLQGKRRMNVVDFLNGFSFKEG